jgi:hypothetical protein
VSNYVVIEGTTIRFYTKKPFTSVSGTLVDPDKVIFSYSVQHGNVISFTYTNGTGDPSGTIVKVSTGNYYADIDTTGLPGVWTYGWRSLATSLGADTSRTQVAREATLTVSTTSL